ncbi:MAG: amino acid decarboxylase [Candidatus Latescibacteria bacterium]|nr:amino acid decarboxylase [Candidatus Latescibacterota bacterium]NIM21418.1 amino acid decarboxylase [Candidatus Latescibacterota bacterium]NIM65599.1 amino acid decarboxylase [Candidatus Latescibacterota bacterium]NIO01979.1 amino acid decarboxylase [Candidatus Latescibacterota bacterium]NIO28791.1 amino acid decarboxylase [Candidatus Latescibacterota bacterium]
MRGTEWKHSKEEDESFRRAIDQATQWIVRYFNQPEAYPVLSRVKPGDIRDAFPNTPPEEGRNYDELLEDFRTKILPGITHWNHPSFFAYFAITGSYPGILGELLSAALNINGMLWRTSPALTEIEDLSLDYLRNMLGIDEQFFGLILDTASTSSLIAMAAARESISELQIREKGLAGRTDVPRLRVYCSQEAHSSIDKAAIVLGVGSENVKKIGVDSEYRMDPSALERLIEEDVRKGYKPFCVVATVGTTSTTSVDPVAEIAEICMKHDLWLHVDAAYAGVAAILPEKKDTLAGCQLADSFVVNPHKWLFTPIDLSAFYCKRRSILRNAFSLVPEYLRDAEGPDVTNLMDYGFQLGRRFRALKLWMVINYYGRQGLENHIREHMRLADVFKAWVERNESFELMAPVPFSTVCFRYRPITGLPEDILNSEENREAAFDRANERLLEEVNRTGKAFLSHTKLHGKFTLRCAIGNIRTRESDINNLCLLLQEKAEAVLARFS